MSQGKVFNSVHDGVTKSGGDFFYVLHRGVLFPYWSSKKSDGSDALTVFFPGSTRREKPLPIFMRQTFSPDMPGDVICVADPSLFYSRDITMAWFAGGPSFHYAATVGVMLNQFLRANKQYKKILLYGTSAGGIPALQVGRIIKEVPALVCVGNAQLNIFSYYKNHREKFFQDMFPKVEESVIGQKIANRLNMNGYAAECEVVCMQNVDDTHHYEQHYLPFKSSFASPGRGTFIEYSDPLLGHSPLPKHIELQLISDLLTGGVSPYRDIPGAQVSKL